MNDTRSAFAVVLFAGLTLLLIVGGGIYLAAADKTLSGELIALGGAALGLLGGVLSPSPFAQRVQVTNDANDPVPVDPQAGHGSADLLVTICTVLVALAAVVWLADRL